MIHSSIFAALHVNTNILITILLKLEGFLYFAFDLVAASTEQWSTAGRPILLANCLGATPSQLFIAHT